MNVGTVSMNHCLTCGRRWKVSFPGCPYCGSSSLDMESVAAAGSVYSWVEVFRSLEEPAAEVPYTVIAVDLTGGGRIFGRWLGPGAPADGTKVHSTSGEVPDAPILFTAAR
jgi:uncharacterized OB-fold protein